ncbi:MAG TPA: hypothetical protein VET90_06235, partial [Candidatus Binatus sp.]|nr:hypothetical protein [Candidatus Binatus sp.]
EPRFQEHFVEAMAIPHRTAPFANLAGVVHLPRRTERQERDGSGGGGASRGRRRSAVTSGPGGST